MTTVTQTRTINAPAVKIWAVLRSFGLDYFPGYPHTLIGEGVGATRTFKLPDGEMMEKVVAHNDQKMRLSYTFLSSPWPIRDYFATIQVREVEGGASEVEWSATFEPEEVSEEAATQIVTGTFRINLKGLEKFITSRS